MPPAGQSQPQNSGPVKMAMAGRIRTATRYIGCSTMTPYIQGWPSHWIGMRRQMRCASGSSGVPVSQSRPRVSSAKGA